VLATLRRHDLEERATLTSFHLSQLRSAHALAPELPLAWLVRTPADLEDDESRRIVRSALVESAAAEGFRMLAFPARELNAELVERARARGLSIRAWEVTSEALLAHSVRVGADGATVDWPDRARRVVRKEWSRRPAAEAFPPAP
jgi:glycerophosphoryl diester phosphodiesterase